MKKIFYYLLPLLLLNQSGTAQQDSLTLRITDEKGQIIIGAVVLQYPESYLLGASNEKGEVEIKGLHIPARQQLVFQCLGYEMKALPFQEVKQHPNVRLKEKITELPEAVVLAQPLPRLLALTHKQLYKKYPAKKEYVRYYAPASYYKSVECKGHCVNLRHEYGLFITSGDNYRKNKWDLEYLDCFIPATRALSYDLTSDRRDTLKRLYLYSDPYDREYNATSQKIFNLMRSVYLYGPLFSSPENFIFKLTDIDSSNYTLSFSSRPEGYPNKNRALSKGTLQIDRQSLKLKHMELDYFDYQLYKLFHNYFLNTPFLTKTSLEFKYDPEGHAYISECSCESIWKYAPSVESHIGSIEKPSRPFAARNQLIEKEKWVCEPYTPVPQPLRTKETFVQALWTEIAPVPYEPEYFRFHPNILATPRSIDELEQYMPLEQQYRQNSNKWYVTTRQQPITPANLMKVQTARTILFNHFFKP